MEELLLLKKYYDNNEINTAFLLSKILKDKLNNNSEYINLTFQIKSKLDNNIFYQKYIRVLLACNWCSSKELCDIWNKMSKGNCIWNNIQIVSQEPCDYYCIINQPPNNLKIVIENTIVFIMEPYMNKNYHLWNDKWMNIDKNKFKWYGSHDKYYNNNEWHLSKTYNELKDQEIVKDYHLSNILSTVLSDKYKDPGHIKRVDFIKFLQLKNDIKVDVFGGNSFTWNNYKGSLPYHKKDNALFPYKYTFNVENFQIHNYYSEKLIDGILSECLVFYHGCPNIKDLIDEKAFVWLELSNFEEDYKLIKKAIEEDWWKQRLSYIKQAKTIILDEFQFFPRLEKIIKEK